MVASTNITKNTCNTFLFLKQGHLLSDSSLTITNNQKSYLITWFEVQNSDVTEMIENLHISYTQSCRLEKSFALAVTDFSHGN